MTWVPSGSHAGRLLVAVPELADPHFRRSVVLLLDHDRQGALGVVLDRPSDIVVEDVLPGWGALAAEPGRVHTGGPVQPEAAICLARLPADSGRRPGLALVPGSRRLATVDLDGDPDEIGAHLAGLRVFAGYAGWAPEQLDAEISAGGWFVVDALPGDVLAPDPEHLWRDVLRRQGLPLALAANFPADPSLN